MNLQSRWDEASKVNWTKLDIPSSRYLSNNLERSYKTISNSPSPNRQVDIDLNSNSQRDIRSFHDMEKYNATQNASTSSVNSSTLGSVSVRFLFNEFLYNIYSTFRSCSRTFLQ